MSKALTHETTYRARVASHATKGSKRGVNLLGWDAGEEQLTCEQERDALVARAKQLNALFSDRDISCRLTKPQRERLGLELKEINERISAIRPRLRSLAPPREMKDYILDVVRERTSKLEFRAIYEEALRRCNAAVGAEGQ